MKRIAIVIALVGCRSEINPAYCVAHEGDPRCPDAGAVPDGPADGATTSDVSTCLGSGLYTVCLATQLPTTNLTVTQDIDTDSTSPCLHFQPPGWVEGGQPPACFVVGVKVTMSSSINARGSRPLVVVAIDSLTISDAIDVSASHGTPTQIPAGFDPLATACAYVTVPADNSNGRRWWRGCELRDQRRRCRNREQCGLAGRASRPRGSSPDPAARRMHRPDRWRR